MLAKFISPLSIDCCLLDVSAGLSFRLEFGISACTSHRRVRRNGHNVTGDVSSCASLLGMGIVATGIVWVFYHSSPRLFLVASLLNFTEGGFVPVSVGIGLFLVMITWRWGRKATFAAYSAKSSMTMAERINLHRNCKVFMERNAVVMAATPVRQLTDRAPAIMQMLWERHGIPPRNSFSSK